MDSHSQCLTSGGRPSPVVGFKWRRIGEAKNPGPFTYGGASSSTGGGSTAFKLATTSFDDPEGLSWEREELDMAVEHAPQSGVFPVSDLAVERRPQRRPGSGSAVGRLGGCATRPVAASAGAATPVLLQQTVEETDHSPQVYGDYEWNQWLNECMPVEGGLSAGHVAALWQDKHDDENMAKDWAIHEEQMDNLSKDPADKLDAAAIELQQEEVQNVVKWTPPLETNPKKAEKWRRRMRRGQHRPSDEPLVMEDIVETEHAIGDQGVDPAQRLDTSLPVEIEEGSDVSRKASRGSRRSKFMSIYSMNTSGKPAAIRALTELAKRSRTIAAVAIQEHHCLQERLPDLEAQAGQAGWKIRAVASVMKNSGPSAGVAIATPKHVPSAVTAGVPLDCSPEASEGRLAALWVQAAVLGGVLVLTVYLWHSEGLTARNVEIVLHALAMVRSHGGPWLILGDFNCAPAELSSAMSVTLEAAGAVILSTRTPTHYPGEGMEPSLIDYCLMDRRLAHGRVVRRIEVDLDLAIGKHRAIRLDISNKGHVCYVTKAIKPRSFPRKVPVGCARAPIVAEGKVEDIGLDAFCKNTLSCAEAELARMFDFVSADGLVESGFVGRGLGFRMKKVLLLLARTNSNLGQAGWDAYLVKWILERTVELRHHHRLYLSGRLTVGALKQIFGIQARLKGC